MQWDIVVSFVAGLLLFLLYYTQSIARFDDTDTLGNLGVAVIAGILGALFVGCGAEGGAYVVLPLAMASFVAAFWGMGVIYAWATPVDEARLIGPPMDRNSLATSIDTPPRRA